MSCGARVPTVFVSLSQTKGALIARYEKHLDALLCDACLRHHFRSFTTNNLLFGWWSLGSALFTPVYTVQNVWAYFKAKAALRRAAASRVPF